MRSYMERIVFKAKNFKEAQAWDIHQHVQMTPQERMNIARLLKLKVFPPDAKDVRACHRKS